MLSKAFLLGVLVIVVSFLYTKWKAPEWHNVDILEQNVIAAWNASIIEPVNQFSRITVGINCNLDLIVPGVELLKALGLKPGQSVNSITVDTLEDLTNTFTHFFGKGAAAERAFTNETVYRNIIKIAEGIPSKEYYIGGNAALMALKIVELFPKTQVQLIGPIGPGLKSLLPAQIFVPEDSLIQSDEVHLIMEYGLHENWGGFQAPVANRFITSYDKSNMELTMMEKYFGNVQAMSPDLVLFSGLHMLESQSLPFVKQKLAQLQTALQNISRDIPVHIEFSSMAKKEFVRLILDETLSYVTSLGLNEQELSFSSYAAGGPHANNFTTINGQPEIHKVSDMILWLLQTYGYSKRNMNSRLTRVHFHSLTYHIVGTLPSAWKSSHSAVAAGATMAGKQACNVKKLSPAELELRIPQAFRLFSGDEVRNFDDKNPVMSWNNEGFHFVFSPVLVCSSPLKTVGLGDAISAAGLMYSEYLNSYQSD